MPRFTKIAMITAGLWFVIFGVFVAHQTPKTQILSALMTLAFLVVILISFVRIFTDWKRQRWRSLIPFVSCMLAIALYPASRSAIRRITFERSLPHYETIIRQIESSPVPISSESRQIEQTEDSSIYHIRANRSPDGVLSVEFLTGGGFPVKHSGYLYCSSGVIIPGSYFDSRWPKKREMKTQWFRISD
jgi:hypothetical protein